jgi:hypothetical protein
VAPAGRVFSCRCSQRAKFLRIPTKIHFWDWDCPPVAVPQRGRGSVFSRSCGQCHHDWRRSRSPARSASCHLLPGRGRFGMSGSRCARQAKNFPVDTCSICICAAWFRAKAVLRRQTSATADRYRKWGLQQNGFARPEAGAGLHVPGLISSERRTGVPSRPTVGKCPFKIPARLQREHCEARCACVLGEPIRDIGQPVSPDAGKTCPRPSIRDTETTMHAKRQTFCMVGQGGGIAGRRTEACTCAGSRKRRLHSNEKRRYRNFWHIDLAR